MSGNYRPLDFENSQVALQHKSDAEVRKSYYLFQLLNQPLLNKFGTLAAQGALSLGLPIHSIIQASVFDQFCGGVSLSDCKSRIVSLAKYGVGTSLDYSVEALDDESGYDSVVEETLQMIDFAKDNPTVEFVVVKPTGIASMSLMEKVSQQKELNATQEKELQSVRSRLDRIASRVCESKQRLFIDAEDSWYQDCVDMLARELMIKYNREKVCIYSTIQFYRKDRLEFLKAELDRAKEGSYRLGFKLVRGAYLEKERDRAKSMGYADPIQDSKDQTDADYNAGALLCLQNIDRLAFCAATHNEKSVMLVAQNMASSAIPPSHPHVFFSQLYGMGDHISFNLAKSGYNVCKYLPYGPVKEMIPYLIRRAQENSSIAGQASRDLKAIKKEIRRRNL